MSRHELLLELDEVLGVPAGTVRGTEQLEDLENWDSTALISFIAMAEMNAGRAVSLNEVVNCSTVADLLRIAQPDVHPVPQR